MYLHDDIHRLSTQQQVSLDKHQQMIDSALRWRQYDHEAEARPEPTSSAKLHAIFATILNIFVK